MNRDRDSGPQAMRDHADRSWVQEADRSPSLPSVVCAILVGAAVWVGIGIVIFDLAWRVL